MKFNKEILENKNNPFHRESLCIIADRKESLTIDDRKEWQLGSYILAEHSRRSDKNQGRWGWVRGCRMGDDICVNDFLCSCPSSVAILAVIRDTLLTFGDASCQ